VRLLKLGEEMIRERTHNNSQQILSAETGVYAETLLPDTKCKTRRMRPTISNMWNKPVDT